MQSGLRMTVGMAPRQTLRQILRQALRRAQEPVSAADGPDGPRGLSGSGGWGEAALDCVLFLADLGALLDHFGGGFQGHAGDAVAVADE